jgi:hypothetical protein
MPVRLREVTGRWVNPARAHADLRSDLGWINSAARNDERRFNTANGASASVSGGERNAATGRASSVSGGARREASGVFDWKAGSLFEGD